MFRRLANLNLIKFNSYATKAVGTKKCSRSAFRVHNDVHMKQFFLDMPPVGDPPQKLRLFIHYKQRHCLRYDLLSTHIPDLLKGLGYEEALASAVMKHLAEKDIKMKLYCPYLQEIYDRIKDGNSKLLEHVEKANLKG